MFLQAIIAVTKKTKTKKQLASLLRLPFLYMQVGLDLFEMLLNQV